MPQRAMHGSPALARGGRGIRGRYRQQSRQSCGMRGAPGMQAGRGSARQCCVLPKRRTSNISLMMKRTASSEVGQGAAAAAAAACTAGQASIPHPIPAAGAEREEVHFDECSGSDPLDRGAPPPPPRVQYIQTHITPKLIVHQTHSTSCSPSTGWAPGRTSSGCSVGWARGCVWGGSS